MDRQPILTPHVEKFFYGVLYGKAEELDLKIHAAGNVEDHAHVVVSIPPKIAVADCVRHLKGSSTFAINHMDGGRWSIQMAGWLRRIDGWRKVIRHGHGLRGEAKGTS